MTAALAAAAALALAAPASGIAAGQSRVSELYFDLDSSAAGDDSSLNYRLGGDAEVVRDFARLTADAQGKAGWMWSKVPTPERMADEWTIEFDVQLHGTSTSMSGDGLALWLTTRPLDGNAAPAGTGQSLGPNFGMPSSFSGLGIFLDTFDNSPGKHSRRFPYIAGVFHPEPPSADEDDREYAHNAPEFAFAMDSSEGCSEPIRSSDLRGPASTKTTTLRLEYEGPPPGAPANEESGILVASLLVSTGKRLSDDSPADAWHKCFVLRGVSLPSGLFLGASASTGDLHDAHDVDRIRVYAPAEAKPRARRPAARTPEASGGADARADPAARPEGGATGGPLCDAKTTAELDAVVAGTATVAELRSDVSKAAGRVDAAEGRLKSRLEAGVRRLEESLGALERAKAELDAKHEALEARAAKVEAAAAALASRRGGWWEGAVVIAVLVMGGVSAYSITTACSASDRLTKAHDM